MATPTTVASVVTNPGGTGSNIVPTLPSHQAGDVIEIFVGKTGNVSWTAPSGWTIKHQSIIGTSSNGTVGTLLHRRVLSTDTLPLPSPTCNLGATVTRAAIALTKRGADIESVYNSPSWAATSTTTGTANPVRPLSVTTPAPEMLAHHYYCQRAATNAPEPTGYTEDQQVIISGTLVLNVSEKNVADQQTVLSNQDASPTSGARWVGMISCTPSADYPYYRSGSQATVANGTSVDPVLPTGTSSSNSYGTKDLVIATIEAAGNNINIQPNTPADWTEITGFATNTSGNGTTVRKYWALYDGSLDDVFTRPTNGELSVCLTTYYNVHQTTPIGAVNIRQNASSTTSTWDALTRTTVRCAMQATCVADGTPTFTVAAGWTERMDGLGISCADQTFNATGSTASASFTLNSASPTAVGLVEIINASASVPTTVIPASLSFTITGFAPILNLVIVPGALNLTTSTFAPVIIKATTVIPSAVSLTLSVFAPLLVEKVTPSTQTLVLNTFVASLSTEIIPATQSFSLTSFIPTLSLTTLIEPATVALSLSLFVPSLRTELIPSAASVLFVGFVPSLVMEVTPDPASLMVTAFAPSLTEQIIPAPESLTLSLLAPVLDTPVTPATSSLVLTSFNLSLRELVAPDIFTLALAAFSPSIQVVVTPSSHALIITTFTPSVNITGQSTVIPATALLTTVTFAPALTSNVIVTVQSAALTVNLLAPHLNFYVTALMASLTVSGSGPLLLLNVIPATADLALTPFMPAVTGAGQDVTVVPDTDILLLTANVVNLRQFTLRGSIDIGLEGHGVDISFESHAV